MNKIEEYVLKHGQVLKGNILKVDSFVNHQIDADFMYESAVTFKEHFKDKKITKVVTIESSGIAPATMLGYLLHVPVVFLKKEASALLNKDEAYECNVHSYTKNKDYSVRCSKKYISEDDHILFIDDFLANGEACFGALNIISQANAKLTGVGILIEKSFQKGRKRLENENIDVCSIVRVASLENNQITFVKQD